MPPPAPAFSDEERPAKTPRRCLTELVRWSGRISYTVSICVKNVCIHICTYIYTYYYKYDKSSFADFSQGVKIPSLVWEVRALKVWG